MVIRVITNLEKVTTMIEHTISNLLGMIKERDETIHKLKDTVEYLKSVKLTCVSGK